MQENSRQRPYSLVLLAFAATLVNYAYCTTHPQIKKSLDEFTGAYKISATPASESGDLILYNNGKAGVSGPIFDLVRRECTPVFWGLEGNENQISLGCSNLNLLLTFSSKNTLLIDAGDTRSYSYTKKTSDNTNTAAQEASPARSGMDLAEQTKADEDLFRPVGALNAQKARDYIKRHNLMNLLKTDQYRQMAIARIKGAEAEDLETARQKKVGGIPTNGRLGGGFRGYPWGTSMQTIRDKHQGLIIHDEGNTIRIQIDGILYQFYFYEDFLASVEIVPLYIEDHTNVFEQLRRSYGKPIIKKQHRDVASNRKGDRFAWKRHEVTWDDGTTAISMQHCETEYDPLNAGCMINLEFNSLITYDSKKLNNLLMKKIAREREANAPF